MSLFKRRSRDDNSARHILNHDKILDMLADHPLVKQQLEEQVQADVAQRQRHVDAIAAAKAHADATMPLLQEEARRLRKIAVEHYQVYAEAERAHSMAVREIMNLSHQTDHTINRHEAQLHAHADSEITDFMAECQDAFDSLRSMPNGVALDTRGLSDSVVALRQKSHPSIFQQTEVALGRIRALKAEAEALRLTAEPDVPGRLDEMRDRLARIVAMEAVV